MATNENHYLKSVQIPNASTVEVLFIQQQVFFTEMNAPKILKITVVIFMPVFFVYLNALMFFALRSKRVFKETPRYILFAHMLLNDSIQLFFGSMLYIFTLALLKIITAACAFVVFVTSITSRNTPLNLAVMSLERYVAIQFPLRHAEIATQKRTHIAIGVIWFIGSINFTVDLIFGAVTDPYYFTSEIYCTRERLLIRPWQIDLLQGFNAFYFVSVAIIILFTYISIMVTARSVSSKKDSAKKAHRTVLLHLIQLGLCLTSFLFSTIERALYMMTGSSASLFVDLRYLNYLIVLILPRCLSPLIYGLRDEAVRPLFTYYFLCGTGKVKPSVNVH